MRIRTRAATVAGACVSGIAALALAVGVTTSAGAVANGEPVEDGRYGFATKLVMTDIPRDSGFYDSACSAALIAPSWIISAGHCFHSAVVGGSYENVSGQIGPDKDIPYGSVTAILGRPFLEGTGGHEVRVVEAYQSGVNDIAIAKLETPVWDVRPLSLPYRAPAVDDILRIAGWGSLGDVVDKAVPQLYTGQVKISSIAETTLGVRGYLPQADTSACTYDSGAPYFAEPVDGGRPTLVGIESDGPTCPHDQEETLARVDPVVAWIVHTMISHN